MAWTLTGDQLFALVAEFADPHTNPEVHAVALVGSYARGDADAFSDIDLKRFIPEGTPKPPDWFGYRLGRFLNVFSGPVEERLAAFRDPGEAIWAVPMFRDMRILLDREGKAAALREAALAFTWDSLQKEADEHASLTLAYQAEYALKILSGLAAGNPGRTVAATWELTQALTRAMAVHHRLLIPSDRVYFTLVRTAAGPNSAWTQQHQIAAGTALSAVPNGHHTPWQTRAIAALHLYRETVSYLHPIVSPTYREAIQATIDQLTSSPWLR